MHIQFLARKLNLSAGGSNRSLDVVATGLAERGHRVEILTLSQQENAVPAERPYAVRGLGDQWVRTQFARILVTKSVMNDHEADTDLFHVFNPTLLPGAGAYQRGGGTVPVIGRLNTYNMFCPNTARMDGQCHEHCTTRAKFAHDRSGLVKRIAKVPFYASETHLEPRLARHVDRFFAISPAVRDIYGHIGLETDDIRVVPNFIDETFEPERATPSNDGKITIVAAGRLKELKGIDVILTALATTGTDAELLVVGDGPQRERLERQASQKGIADRTQFTGWVEYDRLGTFYSRGDVYVHASLLPEPFGRTVLEALQCGLPAIVSDVGGPPWVVGNAGVTFERGNPDSLADVFDAIGQGKVSLERLSAQCLARVNQFDRDRVLDIIETEYRQVASATT